MVSPILWDIFLVRVKLLSQFLIFKEEIIEMKLPHEGWKLLFHFENKYITDHVDPASWWEMQQ